MYSYENLEAKLAAKGISKTNLTHELGISSRTIAKIGKGEKLSRIVLGKIADYLTCDPEELYRIILSFKLFSTNNYTNYELIA